MTGQSWPTTLSPPPKDRVHVNAHETSHIARTCVKNVVKVSALAYPFATSHPTADLSEPPITSSFGAAELGLSVYPPPRVQLDANPDTFFVPALKSPCPGPRTVENRITPGVGVLAYA